MALSYGSHLLGLRLEEILAFPKTEARNRISFRRVAQTVGTVQV